MLTALSKQSKNRKIRYRNMKITTFFNKFLFTLLTLLSFGVVNAWGATLTSKVAVGSGKGTAVVEIWNGYGSKQGTATATDATGQQTTSYNKVSGLNWGYSKYTATAADGYSFGAWYTNSGCTSGEQTANPYSTGTTSKSRTDQYWAKFIPVTVNSVSNPISSSSSALKITAPDADGAKTADIKFTVSSNADAKADFNTPTVSGTGWSLVSWSLSGTTVTVTVKYTATNTTTQGDHTATVTLTSKGDSSKSATVYANVDLTPHISADPTELDFGMFTIGVDASMRKTVTLTFDANAINFSLSSGYNPFTALLSDDHKTLAIDFNPTEVGSGPWTKTITVTTKNSQSPQKSASTTITLKGAAQSKTYPTYTCNIENTYMVDDAAIDLQTLWTSTSNGAITYSIESYTEHGSNNSAGTKPAITSNRYLSLGRACEITLKLTQAGATNYFPDSDTKTITINKYQTSFDGSTYNLMVDGTQTANYTYTNTSAAQPTASSSDAFYYSIDNVSFTNAAKNNGTNLITFNPSTKVITACNAGTAKITLHQAETYKYTGATKSFDVAVYKYKSTFASAANLNVKVDANVTSAYTLTYSKPNNAYIGTVPVAGDPSLNTGDYHYTLAQSVTSDNTTGSPDATIAAAYNAGTKTATGKNAGTCTIGLVQLETYKVIAASTNFTVTVTKNDPTFTWKAGPYYHNSTVSNIFTSSNTDFAYTMGASTDAQVAYVSNNTLNVLSKNGSAQFTVTQGANYKWNSKSQTYTVTPENPSNHVTFTYTQAMYNDGNITTAKSSATGTEWTSSGVRLGGSNTTLICSESTSWDDKYIDIKFLGIPEKVTFTIAVNTTRVSSAYWYVKESSNGSSWSEEKWSSEHDGTSFSGTQTVNLSSTTRYIRLCYSGNYAGYFKDVKVTELKKFTPNPTTLDFGTLDINTTGAATQKTFEFNYANVGHNVTLSTNDAHFTVDPTSITNIGGEKTGAVTIKVNYSTAEVHKATNAKMTITDELGNSTNVTLKGETKKLQPTINWSSDESIFIEEDVLKATNSNGLTVELSVAAADEKYVQCEGNTATILGTNDGTVNVTVTASVTGNAIYADATFTKDITITNLTKQTISWTQDLSHFKTTDATKSKTLDATASSGLAVTYELVGDATGLTLTQNGNTWTLTYSAQECKNTTLVAKQGGNSEYAPASSVSIPVRVIDPTKVCDDSETLVNSSITLKSSSVTYNIDIPESMKISLSRVKTGLLDVYLFGVDVEFYSGRNGTGTKLYTKSYSASDINKSISNASISLSSYIHAKSVKVVTDASNGYYLTSLRYDKRKYCNISDNSLSFSTYPNTVSSTKTFTVSYANYPISVECSNPKFTVSPTEFGDCDEYDTKTISVYYTAGAAEGTDNGYIYIKDNTGATLKTCTLSVSINKVAQSITNHNIQTTYNTTDKVTLTAETNSAAEEKHFTYKAEPAGIASFDGNEMTFSQSGIISIIVLEAGSDVYKPCSDTVKNVVVNKVTPTLTLPAGTNVTYLQNLSTSTLSGGKATVTLRGVADTEIEGSFAWTNTSAQANSAAGNGSYEVTFKPSDTGMYNNATGMVTILVEKANQTLVMKNGSVNVAVDKGIDANSADSKLNLTSLILSQTIDPFVTSRTGEVSFEVISDNAANATISGTIFSAAVSGIYTIRATQAATSYYNAATAEFSVEAIVRTNSLGIASACAQYVGQTVNNVLLNVNSDGEIHSSSTAPTIAYYDKDNNKIVIPNSEAKSFNDTTVTITIWQDANAQFEASAEKTINVTVKKYDNAISCDWTSWTKTMNFNDKAPIRLSSNNAATPLNIDQTGDASIATYYACPSAAKDTIRAWYNIGTTTWSISQDESFMYKAAPAKTLTVKVEAVTKPNDCYVLNETAEHMLFGVAGIETGDSLELSAPGKYLYFDAKKNALGYNYFFIEYSTNGSQFKVLGDEVQLGSSYKTYGPYELPEGTTHVRFKTTTGATMEKYYKNVRVTRKTYFDIEDKDGAKISSMDMPLNIVSNDPINVNSSKKSFYIDYNICADEIQIASNHPYYTIKEADKTFSASATNGVGRREIEVTYTCATSDTSSAVITVYTKYDHQTITVNGRTEKGTQELVWRKPDFEKDTVSLPIGYTGIAATVSSNLPLTYSILQDEDTVIRIAADKHSFEVIGQGVAHLTVAQEGTETLYPVTGTRVIIASGKQPQMIKWFQDLTYSLSEGDTVRLEAEVHVMNPKTGVYVRDAIRTDSIRYTCPENNGKIVIFGKDSLRVIGTGDTYITASVAGDAFYMEAASVTMPIHIRSLSDTCENKLLVDSKKQYEFKPDLDWGFTNLNLTKAEYGDTILIDQTVGKPDKLSFMHMGEVYTAPVIHTEYYQGAIKAQQRIRGAWVDVDGSRIVPTKGAWNELKNIQLDEDADAVMIMREQGAFGYHYVKNVKVTMLPYLRAEETIEISTEVGATVDTTITLQYGNVKAALMAETARKVNNVFMVRNAVFHPDCGTTGTYNWPIRFTPMVAGDWLDTVIIKDSGTKDSILVYIQGHAKPGTAFIYQTDTPNGKWDNDGNWGHNGALPTENDHVIIRNDVTIPADTTVYVKTLSVEETATVNIYGTLVIMESTPDKYTYGNVHVKEKGLIDLSHITSGALKVNDFILDASLGNVVDSKESASGQVVGEEKLVVKGDAYFQMAFDPSGEVTFGWYDFVVPFEVDITDGLYRTVGGEHLWYDLDFRIIEHSEAERAQGKRGWHYINTTMYPGRAYSITLANDNVIRFKRFKKEDDDALGGSLDFGATCSSGEPADRGWNGLGNGTLQHAELNLPGTKVQQYDHTNNVYVARDADQFSYAIGTSFFVQVDANKTISLSSATSGRPFFAPTREMRSVDEFMLSLMNYESQKTVDNLWMSATEEATEEYVIGHDLLKMGTPTEAKIAQMWATKGGNRLCDIEAALVNGNGYAPLSFFAPTDGEFILAVEAMPEDVMLFLTYNEQIVWELTASPYPIDLKQGVTEGYGLRVKRMPQTTTGIDETSEDGKSVRKVIVDDHLYIITPEGAIYDITGKNIK